MCSEEKFGVRKLGTFLRIASVALLLLAIVGLLAIRYATYRLELTHRGPTLAITESDAKAIIHGLSASTGHEWKPFEYSQAEVAHMRYDGYFGEFLAVKFFDVDTNALPLTSYPTDRFLWAQNIDQKGHWPQTPRWFKHAAKAAHSDHEYRSWAGDVDVVWNINHREKTVIILVSTDYPPLIHPPELHAQLMQSSYSRLFEDNFGFVGSEERRWARCTLVVQ